MVGPDHGPAGDRASRSRQQTEAAQQRPGPLRQGDPELAFETGRNVRQGIDSASVNSQGSPGLQQGQLHTVQVTHEQAGPAQTQSGSLGMQQRTRAESRRRLHRQVVDFDMGVWQQAPADGTLCRNLSAGNFTRSGKRAADGTGDIREQVQAAPGNDQRRCRSQRDDGDPTHFAKNRERSFRRQ